MKNHFKQLLTAILAFSFYSSYALNVNSATAEEMAASLNGVGPVLAQSIIAYRTENGPIESIEQFIDIKGIGRSVVEKNLDNIHFSDEVATKKIVAQ